MYVEELLVKRPEFLNTLSEVGSQADQRALAPGAGPPPQARDIPPSPKIVNQKYRFPICFEIWVATIN